MRTVTETLVPASEKPLFWRHFQNYLSELSIFVGKKPVNGEFEYPWFDLYWSEPTERWPFWARLAGDVGGLALVRLDNEDGRREISEFYVLPRLRRKGIGLQFARRLLSRFPGTWKLNQASSNVGAIAFWHHVLDGFATYEERRFFCEVERLEQRFTVGS